MQQQNAGTEESELNCNALTEGGQLTSLEQKLRRDIDDLRGLTFRCEENSCGGRLVFFWDEETKEEEGLICEDCAADLVEIHPAIYYFEHPHMEILEGVARVLLAILDEDDVTYCTEI